MVVDDDRITNGILCRMLSRGGFLSAGVFDVASALETFRAQAPELVLLDVNLPDGNGFDLCRTLLMRPGVVPTPVLFISADNDTQTKVRGFEAGGVDFITKPLANAEVLARVCTHLRLRQAHERLVELQASQIRGLAGAQEAVMPSPEDFPAAKFDVSIDQVLLAGGDFYDVIPVGNQVFDYIVADASGHDLAASFWTAALKTLLTEYATPASTPRDILRAVNSALCRILPEGTFFTLIYARLNRQTGRLSLVNAGHPPAVLLRRSNSEFTVVHGEADVAGAFTDALFSSSEFTLGAGDRFYLYSDGLIEPLGSRDPALSRLGEACRTSQSQPLGEAIRTIRQLLVAGPEAPDDTLLLGAEV